jgi:hypothetical protein
MKLRAERENLYFSSAIFCKKKLKSERSTSMEGKVLLFDAGNSLMDLLKAFFINFMFHEKKTLFTLKATKFFRCHVSVQFFFAVGLRDETLEFQLFKLTLTSPKKHPSLAILQKMANFST